MIRLAELSTTLRTQDGEEQAVRLEGGLEILRPQLALKEGETTTLALFRVLYDPTSAITVTLEIGEADRPFLSVSPPQLAISEESAPMLSVTAVDNNDFARIDPINIRLSLTVGDARLTPTETIAVSVENDDVYAIGFDREAITLEEGMSATVRLSIDPEPAGAVTVALSVSDNGQLTATPEELVFSEGSTNLDVVVAATDDDVAEPEKAFTVSPAPPEDIHAMVGSMSVTVPADSDTPTVRVFADRSVIPEGSSVSVLIDADLGRDLTINMAASGPMGAQTAINPPSLTLSPNSPSASFSILVEGNEEPQADNITFDVGFTAMSSPQPELSSLTFTVPPNDLAAHAAMRAEFTLENERGTQTMTVNITPPLRDDKSFLVFSEDPRLIVNTGLITADQSPFPVELALSEDTVLGKEETLSLSVRYMDSWRQRSAQAQLSAGGLHSCGIKADKRTVACWGSDANGRSSPTSSPQVNANTSFLAVSSGDNHSCGIKTDGALVCWGPGNGPPGVDADARFLAVSAGDFHSCGIKADNTLICWGMNNDSQANPMSSPQGVNADTRFLAVSAGLNHSCGIKADNTVACWGNNDNNQSDPTSGPQGVNADTRFLAVSVGWHHSCGLKADNTVACWGGDDNNQSDPTSSPQGVDADARFLAVSAGGGPSTPPSTPRRPQLRHQNGRRRRLLGQRRQQPDRPD